MQDTFRAFLPILKSTASLGDDDSPWIFEGIASTPSVDLVNEVVYPESFKNSLDFFCKNGKIYYDHSYAKPDTPEELKNFTKEELIDLKLPIGKPLECEVRDEGLYIKGVLNKKHPIARRIWEKFLTNPDKQFRNQIGLSIGAKYLGQPRKEYDSQARKWVVYLPELLLYEVSMTPQPVNPETKTWAVAIKSLIALEAQRMARKKDGTVLKNSEVLADPQEQPEQEGASGALEALLASDVSESESAESDASTAMVLDKLDSLLEMISTLAGRINTMVEATATEKDERPRVGVPEASTDEAREATKAIISKALEGKLLLDQKTLKSTLKALTAKSHFLDDMRELIRSCLTEALSEFEARLVETLTAAFEETQKSVSRRMAMYPNVRVHGEVSTKVPKEVRKSIASEELDNEREEKLVDLIEEYISIRGATPAQAAQRAQVVARAEEELGLSSLEFHAQVRKYERSKR